MPQKGFTAIVNKLHIHAMRTAAAHDVQAGQSEAQFFHVYRRERTGELIFLERKGSFDSAFDYCITPTTLH
ncbi:hypothetical protein AWV80_28330 [Cupriavidus sp. UYMU48A]|nr:hypothetical protein AWV80_28330 [Cupriavidus sp. UYMU48A]